MPSKKKKSKVLIRGPVRIHRADCASINVGYGGVLRMSDEEWKGWIDAGILKSAAGKLLKAQIAGETNSAVVANEEFSASLAVRDAKTQSDFRVMKTDGQPLEWNYVEGADTLAESRHPADAGMTWVGFESEPFDPDQIQDLDSLTNLVLALDVKQWTPTPYEPDASRISMILHNLTDGSDIEAKASDPINPVGPVPVVNCVSPRQFSVGGGETVIITGANFFPGATVQFGREPAAAVTVIAQDRIEAITPTITDPGDRSVIVVQSAGNGAQSSLDDYQMVEFI